MFNLERFHVQLQINHVSRTQARDVIFLEICRLAPYTIQQLVLTLRNQTNQATLYRAITKFQQARIIHQPTPGHYELTDIFQPHRHELICRNCGRRIGFSNASLEKTLTSLANRRRFALEEHTLSLSGICELCQPSITPRKPIGTRMQRLPSR